jgi:hypothetical protein
MVLESAVLRRLFGIKRSEVTSVGKISYMERSCAFCVTKYLGGQIKRNEMGGACGRYGW